MKFSVFVSALVAFVFSSCVIERAYYAPSPLVCVSPKADLARVYVERVVALAHNRSRRVTRFEIGLACGAARYHVEEYSPCTCLPAHVWYEYLRICGR